MVVLQKTKFLLTKETGDAQFLDGMARRAGDVPAGSRLVHLCRVRTRGSAPRIVAGLRSEQSTDTPSKAMVDFSCLLERSAFHLRSLGVWGSEMDDVRIRHLLGDCCGYRALHDAPRIS